jgi:hypothetical protein
MLMAFTIFCLLVDKKNQSFSLLFRNYLLILNILSVTFEKDPTEAFLTLKMHTESRLAYDSDKSCRKPPVTN